MSTGTATQNEPRRAARPQLSAARRWGVLAAATGAQAASSVTVHGPAFLIPVLHHRLGLTLAEAGLVAAAPLAGLMAVLLGWGVVVDRIGERFSLLAGLGIATAAGALAAVSTSVGLLATALFVAGTGAAATASASGRMVAGWFPREQRGIAMGIRQMAQPLGVGVGAATMAVVADDRGLAVALWVPTAATALAAVTVALVVIDPPRPAATRATAENPYRTDRYLLRVHTASVLLVVPQFLVWTFSLTWLIDDLGWAAGAAGTLVGLTQLVGATARVATGWWSDRVGGRLRPMRMVAAAAAAVMATFGAVASLPGPAAAAVAIGLMTVASAITVADNGLAFTAVTERAGPFWSGRALAVQNTAQHAAAAAVPPAAGLVITLWGHGTAFALCALLPLLAIRVVPVADERPVG